MSLLPEPLGHSTDPTAKGFIAVAPAVRGARRGAASPDVCCVTEPNFCPDAHWSARVAVGENS